MHVGLLCPYSLSLPGGVQGQVLGLARALRNRGHDVQVLGPCDGPPPEPGITPLGNCIPLAANGSVAPIAPDPSAALRTIRALSDERFDVLHLHEPMVPGCNMTALLFKPAPVVATFHAAGQSASYRWLRVPLRVIARRIDVRCAVSRAAASLARAAVGRDATVELLWNGIELERAQAAEPWPSDGPAIFFVGRHEHRKGVEVLLEAFEHVEGDVRLWLAGAGPDSEVLQSRFRDERIEWLGRISDAEKLRRLRGATVACFPSLGGESFGIVLLEAMAAGTALVATDIDGYRNVAANEQDALLVEPDDPLALAKALDRVLSDRRLATDLAAAGLAKASELSMEALAERYEAIYRRVVPRG